MRLDPRVVREALREAGLRARHGLSQNFLADVEILERIVATAEPGPGRRVLEIGPGLGVLTGALLDAGAAVVAVELDHGLADRIRRRFESAIELAAREPDAPGGLRLVEGDVLDVAIESLIGPPYDVVANLPYHITSPVLHRMLDAWPRPERAVLMLQREVAERIAAPPGAMSYLSVFVQYHASVRVEFVVPPGSFEPEPAVESAVVVVEPRSADRPAIRVARASQAGAAPEATRLEPDAEEALWRLVQAAFRERRKMLHNVLARQLPIPADRVAVALRAAGIAPDRRPQTVSVEEWLRLLAELGPIGSDERGRKAPPDGPGSGRRARAARAGRTEDAAGAGAGGVAGSRDRDDPAGRVEPDDDGDPVERRERAAHGDSVEPDARRGRSGRAGRERDAGGIGNATPARSGTTARRQARRRSAND